MSTRLRGALPALAFALGLVGLTGTAAAAGSSASRAQEFREVTVPAGTILPLVLDTSVSSVRSRAEDPVRAHTRAPVRVRGLVAIPAGSRLQGIVTTARRSGRVKGRADVGFRFHSLRAANTHETYRIRTGTVYRRAPGTKKRDAATIVLPAAGGGIVGGIAGGKKGAVIGTAVGGGAGTGVVLATRGKEVSMPAGRAITVRLLQPITVRVPVRS